ncbi:MAG: hydrolase [SAR86 cluster bacterium]|uniref:Hydrolase n=1 Tax=SAR86 cluster bacterium TaxID=2030880 RepID=A0A2A4MVX5_9GAMM|nr:MAG: hydrolase [SAR86 cluster bacterium]
MKILENKEDYRTTLLAATFYKLCLLFFILIPSTQSLAQQESPYNIPRVSQAPNIDGTVQAQEWSDAYSITLDIETNPGDNIKSEVTAQALIMEDGETLYVAFIALDPDPSQIRAFYRDRDNLQNDDIVGIVLDTFNGERRAYEFFVNPLGIQRDAINDELNRSYDRSWNAIWESAGSINNEGYHVEMAIPLKQLRFPQGTDIQTWGIDLVRMYSRNTFHRVSHTPLDRDISCYLCAIAKMEGFADLEAGTNLEIIPTLTTRANQSRDGDNGSWQGSDINPEASLDIRWGITQDIYLNATVNPDFSQVEADSTQLDINNTFSLYFPERRTFFLDGADYFKTFANLVHTRNIAAPDYGVKLTGKSGRHSYGILNANDTFTSFVIPESLSSSVATLGEIDSDVSIGRYNFDVGEKSSIGAIVTNRSSSGYSNNVVALDGVFHLSDQDTVYIQSMHSKSAYPGQIQEDYDQSDKLSDSSTVIDYRHFDRRWDWRAQFLDYGKDFRADLGFINRVDYKKQVYTAGHTWRWDDQNFFTRIRIAADYDRTEDQSGLQLEEETEFMLNMNGPMQSYLSGLFGGSETYWDGQYFDERFAQINTGFSPLPNLSIGLHLRDEDIVDFTNTQLGHSKRFGTNIRYQWGQHLQLDLQQTLQQFDVQDGRLFTANITDAKASYQFDARSFLRFTVQYSDNERNPELYTNEVRSQNKKLSSQLLYSYRLNAVSRFFIGYADSGFADDSQQSIQTTDRSIFAKFSYAWLP